MKLFGLSLVALLSGSSAFTVISPQKTPAVAPLAMSSLELSNMNSDVLIQGGETVRTWSVQEYDIATMQLDMKSPGRPGQAMIELWYGPNYTPTHLKLYTEDGSLRPFKGLVTIPKAGNTLRVRNINTVEYPLIARVSLPVDKSLEAKSKEADKFSIQKHVQGAESVVSYVVPEGCKRVYVSIKTIQRNIKARVELLNGPNNIKNMVECYSSDGLIRPLFFVLETPDSQNVIRIINEYQLEFPFDLSMEFDTSGPPKQTNNLLGPN